MTSSIAIVRTTRMGRGGARLHRLAALADGDEIGAAQVSLADGGDVELTDLAVTPAYRGRQIGKALICAAAVFAAKQGARRLRLASADTNGGRLDAWYRRLGFADQGRDQLGRQRFAAPIGALLARLG